MTRLLAFGDLHLGAGAGLGRQPGDRLRDQEQVLDRIREVALEHDVDALLDAGDTFQGPAITPEQLAVFARFVSDAREAGHPVVAISGNGSHDAAMRQVNGVDIFQYVPGVTVYSRPGLIDLGAVQVACLPWVSPTRLVASMDGDVDRDHVNEHAARLLVKVADGLCDPGIKPTVLMLHGSISGASLPTGISTDDLREPVLPLDDLVDLGYACVVASHIHVPQYDNGDGWIQPVNDPLGHTLVENAAALYTGSPMPLNFGEAQVRHGVWILDADASDNGPTVEFVPIESRPLVSLEWLAAEPLSWTAEDLEDGAIVKVRITGTRAEFRHVDLGELRAALLDSGAHTVKIETETIREDRGRVAGVTADLQPLDAFDAWAAANEIDAPDARAQMQADLEQVGA